jgi:DNA-binding MarR family transcriptional regulator
VILKEKEKKTQEISGTNWSESVLSFIAFSLVLIFLILLSRYKKILFPSFATKTLKTKKENLKNKEFNILHEILEYRGTLLTGEKFDEIVGLNSITNLDTKRVMRSKMIKSLNSQYLAEHGKELITRIKSTEDRRIIYYSITNHKSHDLTKAEK